MNKEVKFPKPRGKCIYDMTDAEYLAHVAEKILKGQRPRPMKTSFLGDHKIVWSAKKK